MSKQIWCHLVVSDIHIPFHNDAYLNAFLRFCPTIKPDYIHILGDLCDNYYFSSYLKNPELVLDFSKDLSQIREFLYDIRRRCPKSKIIFSEGNHEYRLKKFLWNKAPELSRLAQLDWPHILDLNKLKIRFFRYREPYEIINGDYPIIFHHGDTIRKYPGMSARVQAESLGKTVVVGHSHRMAVQPITFVDRQIYGIENGCLVDIRKLDYINYAQWQCGWTVIWHWKKGISVEQVYLNDNGYIYQGKYRPICSSINSNCTSSQLALIISTK